MRARVVAIGLLVGGVAHNVAHRYAPEAARGYVWNITGALLLAAVLILLSVQMRHPGVWLVSALLAGHAAQVAGCSIAYLWDPWPVVPGADLCSDALGFPLAVLGVVAVALIAGAPIGK